MKKPIKAPLPPKVATPARAMIPKVHTPVKAVVPAPAPAPVAAPKVRTPVKPSAPLVSIKTTSGKIRVPDTISQKSDHPPLYDTLSMLGFLLAAMRSQESYVVQKAMAHVSGFIRDLNRYKIPFPVGELEDVRHYAVTGRWSNAYGSLQVFSRAFGPAFRKAIYADNSIPSESISIADSFLDMIAARDPARWSKQESTAVNKFKHLGNPELSQVWRVKIEGDQEDDMQSLEDVVKEAVGAKRKGAAKYTLSFEEKNTLRKNNPTLMQKYNNAYTAAMKKYRAVLRNYVLDHGDIPQPVPEVREALEEQGIFLHELPEALDSLYIRSDGDYSVEYEGEMLKIKQHPQPGTTIGRFNDDYIPTEKGQSWVFQYKTDEGDWIYATTELAKRTFKTEKSADIMPMLDSVPDARPHWIKQMSSKDNKISMCALLTEICYLACSRIGDKDGFTKGFGTTYGISTLLVEHCFTEKDRVVLEYPGKGFGKGGKATTAKQVHIFTDANRDEHRIAQYIRKLEDGKEENEPLFTYSDGKPVTATHVRNYMKTLGILHLTPHKMRSIRGTRLMRELLKKYKKSDLQKMPNVGTVTAGERIFKLEAVEVGKLLGHVAGGKVTANTAIAAYIDPTFAQAWFTENGLRVPTSMKTLLNNAD